jgi:ABC-2 type transport system ATP-binding protein
MIEAASLVKRYGILEAVKGVSFHVGDREIVGLLGPNGAGKTSLMRLLTCYHFPDSGTARVGAHDVTLAPHRVRQLVGYLPESSPLYPDMKVSEYLGFIADARGLRGAPRRQRIDWVVDTCGLTEVFSRDVRKLSRGYRQRAGLAQAILHDPAVLVLDEPTSGLDPNQIVEIRALIRNLGSQKTVLLSTHIMQEVEAVCGRVLIMNEGRLAAQGTAEEIARSLRESLVLSIAFKGPVGDGEAAALGGLPGVLGVSAVRRVEPERTEVELSIAAGSDPAEPVYDWALARGLKILGLATRKISLEALFARLTALDQGTVRGSDD